MHFHTSIVRCCTRQVRLSMLSHDKNSYRVIMTNNNSKTVPPLIISGIRIHSLLNYSPKKVNLNKMMELPLPHQPSVPLRNYQILNKIKISNSLFQKIVTHYFRMILIRSRIPQTIDLITWI